MMATFYRIICLALPVAFAFEIYFCSPSVLKDAKGYPSIYGLVKIISTKDSSRLFLFVHKIGHGLESLMPVLYFSYIRTYQFTRFPQITLTELPIFRHVAQLFRHRMDYLFSIWASNVLSLRGPLKLIASLVISSAWESSPNGRRRTHGTHEAKVTSGWLAAIPKIFDRKISSLE